MKQGTVKTYKGKSIQRLFSSGMFEFYSDKQRRFVKFDTLEECKAAIREDQKP